MNSRPIRLAIFDLGGVVVDVESDRLMHNVSQLVGKPFDDVLETLYHRELLLAFELGEIKPEDYYEGLRRRIKLPWTFAQFTVFWNEILIEKKDVTSVIARLDGRCRLAVLSNTNALHLSHMKSRIPVLRKFDPVVGSCDIGACKPDPRSYQAVLEKTGIPAQEAAYFDDRHEMVEGARKVGLNAVRFESAAQLERELKRFGLLE